MLSIRYISISISISAIMGLGGCATLGQIAATDTPLTGPEGAVQCATAHNPGQERTIGAEGGTLVADRHTLNIPSEALAEDIEISFRHPPRSYVVVEARPSGTRFARPATVTVSYEHCDDERNPRSLQLWGWRDADEGWYPIESQPVGQEREIQAEIDHFTSFALGST